MHPNAQTLQRFYTPPSASLTTPPWPPAMRRMRRLKTRAFSLKGREQIGGMWRMLCSARPKATAAKHWKLEYSGIEADANGGRAHWEAHYLFSATGRKVHNIIDGTFTFTDGPIATHRDRSNFWRWARQALGLPGVLLGWSPSLKRKVRSTAARELEEVLG